RRMPRLAQTPFCLGQGDRLICGPAMLPGKCSCWLSAGFHSTPLRLRRFVMFLFIPRSLCALKRVAAKAEHHRFGAPQGIRIALESGLYRAEATDGRRAVVVQGQVPVPMEEPPWPGFRDLPDDACETIVLPKDLERASKLGDESVQGRFGMVGM